MGRIGLLLFFALLIASGLAPALASEKGAVPFGREVSAQAAILMDRQTGQILWQRNAEKPLPMASTTKIMTAMVILDNADEAKLREKVTVSEHAFATGGSSVLAAGNVVTLEGLLQAALIRSSNEATVAAAEFLAGDEQTFVGWMNDKAKAIGLRHTNFVNPHGLYDPQRGAQHYSSAHDLAITTQYALTNYPRFRQIITMGRPKPVYLSVAPRGIVNLENRNKEINCEVPGIPGSRVDGVKTGYVSEAGKCLVSSATCHSWQLIAVMLDSKDIWADSRALLHYGFSQFAWKTYADENHGAQAGVRWGALDTIPLGAQGILGAPVPREGSADQVVFRGAPLRAPIHRGDIVGEMQLVRDGKVIATARAIALADSPLAWWVKGVRFAGIASLILVIFLLAGKIYGTRTKIARRRRRQFQATGRNSDHNRASDGQWRGDHLAGDESRSGD